MIDQYLTQGGRLLALFNKLSIAHGETGLEKILAKWGVYVSTNIGPVLFSNGAGYKNLEVDRLLDAAAASADRAERAKLYGQMQQLLTDDVPYFWLIDSQGYRAYRATYQGFRTSGGNILEAAWTTGAGR